jgi:nicotinamidase-related amidase
VVRRDARAALIEVGLQNDLAHPQGFFHRRGLLRLSDAERARVVEHVERLATSVRRAEWPVVHAVWQLRPDHLDAAYARPWWRLGLREAGALVRGSWGAELLEGVTQAADDFVVPLVSHSAFQFTHLDRILRNCGVQTCLVVGGSASGGVEDTARQAAAYGYRVLLVADAIYPAALDHLRRLANRAETVSTTDQALALLDADVPVGVASA